jgi:cation:H+ antiporter
MYALAMGAGLLHVRAVNWVLAVALVVGYVFYARRHFQAPVVARVEEEGRSEIRPLYASALLGRPRHELPGTATESTNWPTFLQVAVALILIVGGASLFVDAVDAIATRFGLSHLVFALLVAPVATELPEKFNSVIWVRRGQDTLALGNMTGAMVFQSSFPVTVGLLLTPWHLAHEALVAGGIALAAGTILYLTVRLRGRFSAPLLLLQGGFYAIYVVYVLTRPG